MTGRRKYGGVTLNRRVSSVLRALLVGVACRKTFDSVPPQLMVGGFSVAVVHPVYLMRRTSLVRLTRIEKCHGRIGGYPCRSRSDHDTVGNVLGRLRRVGPRTHCDL